MCGIAGIYPFNAEETVQAEALARMAQQLRHRGPDGEGMLCRPGIGLVHTRLAIIDPEGGRQPIANEDGSVWTVCNGEIFNYVELREELMAKGHHFRTGSDTEVLVHLYEEHGDELVHRLNGQFAFAIYDMPRRRLLLARDRVGIAPLYYCRSGGRLLFGSEIKALLPLLDAAPRPNPRALDQLMTFWAPLSPETLFEGIFELAPGELMTLEGEQEQRRRYWDWAYPRDGDFAAASDDELAEQLHDLLEDSIRLRLRADVPVGAYLSGGLDSSALAALARRQVGDSLATFSIGFEDGSLDEGAFQREMAAHLGTRHSHARFRNSEVAERFPDTIRHTESPVLRTAPAPMGALSALAREQGYKTVLTGEGADEVLGGYDLFKEAKIRRYWARDPDSERRAALLKRLYPYLDLTQRQSQAYLKNFFGVGLDQPDYFGFSHLPRWTTTAKCKEFFSPALREQLGADAQAALQHGLPPAFPAWHSFNRAQYLEAKLLMSGYLLSSQGDRMLMANAVEGRFPFLDHRLIEFAARLPPRLKMRGLCEKYLLRRAVGRYLPPRILQRAKQPYRAPDIPAFFSERTPEYVTALLSEDSLRRYGYFEPNRVGLLLKKIRAGRAIGYKDNMALVGILSTQLWHHHFVEGWYREYAAAEVNTAPALTDRAGVMQCP